MTATAGPERLSATEPLRVAIIGNPNTGKTPLCNALTGLRQRVGNCAGVTVERLADVGPALQAAVRAQADGTCTVLEMMVTQELGDPFRRDALSKPVRYLPKYRDYT